MLSQLCQIIFKNMCITIDTNLIETDVLDVSFNSNTGKYFPFKKPNNTLKIQLPTANHQVIAINNQQMHFRLNLSQK